MRRGEDPNMIRSKSRVRAGYMPPYIVIASMPLLTFDMCTFYVHTFMRFTRTSMQYNSETYATMILQGEWDETF